MILPGGFYLIFQYDAVGHFLTLEGIRHPQRLIVVANQVILAPDAEDALRQAELLTHKAGQHLQQHIRAAHVIAVADQILCGSAVHTVGRVCHKVDEVILSAPIVHIGSCVGIILQIDHADGSPVLHGSSRIDGLTYPVKDIKVEGANSFAETDYDLWYANFDNATTGSAELTITWS